MKMLIQQQVQNETPFTLVAHYSQRIDTMACLDATNRSLGQ